MKVLLTAASQHGATTEVAEAIARRLKADGLEVVCKPPQDVDSLEDLTLLFVVPLST